MKLNHAKIPQSCIHLIPLAEKWGIGDDCDREAAVSNASKEDLDYLVQTIQELHTEDLYD